MAEDSGKTGMKAVAGTEPPAHGQAATGRRLIEEWLPIAELSEESIRERRSMTALPPTYYLHVWWARRPLVASRAAVLASLLPADADRGQFRWLLGIHGDPVAAKKEIEKAQRTGQRVANPYTYDRAFSFTPTERDLAALGASMAGRPVVLDPTAGGGSVPFEALRLGLSAVANDLNPVAWLILKATVEFPARFGYALLDRFNVLAGKWLSRVKDRMGAYFPPHPDLKCPDFLSIPCRGSERPPVGTVFGQEDATYLLARTVTCPYCGGLVPLSPNWRLNAKGVGVRLRPRLGEGAARRCEFEIVQDLSDQSEGTVKGGDGKCPFPDCGRVIDGDEIKRQAKAGKMGEQLYAVVYRERKVVGYTGNGKAKIKMVRGFRAPRPEDDVSEKVRQALEERMPEWQARGIVPDEQIPEGLKTMEPIHYGMKYWRNMFSPRQLLGHCVSVSVFHDLVDKCGGPGNVGGLDSAAMAYLALALDKGLDRNSRLCTWDPTTGRIGHTFQRHDFAMVWSMAEMAPTITGLGYDWAIEQTGKALGELIELSGHPARPKKPRNAKEAGGDGLFVGGGTVRDVPVAITCGSGDSLGGVPDGSVDAVVMDPPYYDNVMYAELADFFYVWLKRTAGLLYPEQFAGYLTDKDREAVANPAKFKDFSKVKGSGGAKKRAARDYRERMQAIFAECRRVLKADGMMTLMFTHKATGAWDALAKGLVEAGFVITASWPVSTEAEGSLHIKDKNAAKSTIFLVCRPRAAEAADAETTYWEDIEPQVVNVVRSRVEDFEAAGMKGVDLYLSCFGPALQVFSEHWPMIRGRAAQKPRPARGAQLSLLEDEEWDPYAVRPEDALMSARAAVKDWRIQRIGKLPRKEHLDPVTEFFVLAWDAYGNAVFPADEALKLARVVGVNFDEQLRGKVLEVKGGDVVLWDSATRAKKGSIGSVRNGVALNALHQAARAGRERNVGAARDLVERAELANDAVFKTALDAVLNVLPTPQMVSGTVSGPMQGAAADAAALEKLRQLVFAEEIKTPQPWLPFEGDGATT